MTKAMTMTDNFQVNTSLKSANSKSDNNNIQVHSVTISGHKVSEHETDSLSAHSSLIGKSGQSGFTLIEIMVVIVILAILAGLVVPKVVGQSDKARVKTTETALATVSNALDMYKVDNSRYPTTAQGLEALTTPPADAKNYPEGGYIKGGYPTDGWENEMQYVAPGSEGRPYDLFSLGADGQQGGEGQDADLYAQL
jgi:general secretion pathway protein G